MIGSQRLCRVVAVFVFVLGVCGVTTSISAAWQVGAATSEMVAEDTMVIGGGIGPGLVKGQEGKLQATAIVIHGDIKLCIVAVDILMINRDYLDQAAQQIEQATGIPTSHVFINSSHTHHAPSTVTIHGYDRDEEFCRRTVAAIVEAAKQANAAAKRAIGVWAAKAIANDEVVILDAGSTTEQIAVNLDNRPVTIVTNGLRVINRLVSHDQVRVLVLGGSLRGFNETIHGGEAEAMLRRIYARRAFVGADALDPVRGVASRTYEQSRLKSLMIENAIEVYVVADASKLGDNNFSFWSELPRHWTLVTSGDTDEEHLAPLRAAGAEIVRC